jgi:hypothetical protein
MMMWVAQKKKKRTALNEDSEIEREGVVRQGMYEEGKE